MGAAARLRATRTENSYGQWTSWTHAIDCVDGARYLAERSKVDGNRLAIRGGRRQQLRDSCAP